MRSPHAIAALERREATARGQSRDEIIAEAIERYRVQAERDGWQVGGEPIEPVTQGGAG